MTLDEFLYVVRDRGEYDSRDEAEQVSRAVLTVLANRITPGEAKDLSAQLPAPLSSAAQPDDNRPDSYGVEEFCRRIAERVGGHTRTAEWDASAVLSTVADAVSGGELNQVLSQLPSGYAPLFGKPELS
jgi:uncharacterized protein (DUF2267 family)